MLRLCGSLYLLRGERHASDTMVSECQKLCNELAEFTYQLEQHSELLEFRRFHLPFSSWEEVGLDSPKASSVDAKLRCVWTDMLTMVGFSVMATIV